MVASRTSISSASASARRSIPPVRFSPRKYLASSATVAGTQILHAFFNSVQIPRMCVRSTMSVSINTNLGFCTRLRLYAKITNSLQHIHCIRFHVFGKIADPDSTFAICEEAQSEISVWECSWRIPTSECAAVDGSKFGILKHRLHCFCWQALQVSEAPQQGFG